MTTTSSFARIPEGDDYTAFSPPDDNSTASPPPDLDFAKIRRSPEFQALRRRLTTFIFPMTALFLCWYLTYVLLAAYAHDFMSYRVTGSITAGLLLGLSQFAMTVVIMLLYVRFTRRSVDPQVEALRRAAGARRS